ncbi:MAG: DUF975 family protein [Defluviitaleaceae bacterium]|nr:DUF975 family protein [Defluviitaleaceae bacterium]
MKSRQEIKAIAKLAMKEQRGTSIATVLLVALVSYVGTMFNIIPGGELGPVLVLASVFIVDYPIMVNASRIYIKLFNREQASAGELFTNFSVNYWRKVGGMAWMFLFLFLWMLPVLFLVFVLAESEVSLNIIRVSAFLLSVPVVIKFISYSMTAFILADCPEVPARQAIRLSIRITSGHKLDLFLMTLSFIGWIALCILPVALGFIFETDLGMIAATVLIIVFLYPYMAIAQAGLYMELRDKAVASGSIDMSEIRPWVQ